jgi:hypothetical protein
LALGIPGSATEDFDAMGVGKDKFKALIDWPHFKMFKFNNRSIWKPQIEVRFKLGLGNSRHRIVEVDGLNNKEGRSH